MSRYLTFSQDEAPGKTKVYSVNSARHGYELGRIHWYGPWRQYVFAPSPDTEFNNECLQDITQFLERLMAEGRAKA